MHIYFVDIFGAIKSEQHGNTEILKNRVSIKIVSIDCNCSVFLRLNYVIEISLISQYYKVNLENCLVIGEGGKDELKF